MDRSKRFVEKLRRQEPALGTVISFADPTVTELLAEDLDFVWIDMEHSPQTLQTVQAHVMAAGAVGATSLVRVPWNDHVLIKPVLDCGADGIVVPMVRSAEDGRAAVAACLYPPQGVRGYGPRRPSRYGRDGGPDFCRKLNENMICIFQIEHKDAIRNIKDIVAVPGVTSLVIGPNDLGGSLGHMGEPRHPEVLRAIDTVLESAGQRGLPVGIGIGADPQFVKEWIEKGMRWIALGSDSSLLLGALGQAIKSAQVPAPDAGSKQAIGEIRT
jgi:2-dehydro-3-deoxyglucarate aldolase/4-hydroxy-2-oxoheptanedioate aldolase